MPEFRVVSDFTPMGDQPQAIQRLTEGIHAKSRFQTLLGVTGSGKTATMAWLVEQVQMPTLVLAPNKTLAAQLSAEFQELFPENAVEYFVSYYDYYQPEAYVPRTHTYIEKETITNEDIDRLRHSAMQSILTRRDTLVVASVSCIYGLGAPEDYGQAVLKLQRGELRKRDKVLRHLTDIYYARNDYDFTRGTFRVRGDTLAVHPADLGRDLPGPVLRDHAGEAAGGAPGHRGRAGGEGRLAGAARPDTGGGPAAPADQLRPGDAARDRRLLGRRELLAPHVAAGRRQPAVDAARLLSRRLPAAGRRVAHDDPAGARDVLQRQGAQGRAGGARLPAAVGAGQPPADLHRV